MITRLRDSPSRLVKFFLAHQSYFNKGLRSATAWMGKSTLLFEHRNGETEPWLLVLYALVLLQCKNFYQHPGVLSLMY
ncbi:hypothetical protein ARMGADRAFT_479584 [Armillaria gallica]|uniref:Uncharacterized protein n=1 Tax=Armillaria gallica TaxID=47427 RepID=A0A2H3DCD7_ARMGA|nr:hypothetical protein ARMGADRAFT_479584 [Armillaria gallica]